nr:T9SS type A sorting domain-containing protein [Bacteroidota bacterium]
MKSSIIRRSIHIFLFVFLGFLVRVTTTAQACLPEGIIFSTQADIDNFQINFPGCTEVEGNVLINGEGIANLEGLGVLTFVGGYLAIYACNSLDNLSGLDGLTSIGKFLWIGQNNSLTALEGLGALVFIEWYLWVEKNPILPDLSGLGSLATIGGGLGIWDNDGLTGLQGLAPLTSFPGSMVIWGNDALIDFTGLGALSLIEGSLQIENNSALLDLSGLDEISYIADELWIGNNNSLVTLAGLNSLDSIGGGFYLNNNDALTSLYGLDQVTGIGGNLSISNNLMLENLTGLNVLTTINGSLQIFGNEALTNLSGLHNIEHGSIADLRITNNYLLSACDVESICSYLSGSGGTVTISDNDIGCNSRLEVEIACGIVGVENIGLENEFLIYPNPAGDVVYFSAKAGLQIIDVNIYNHAGQVVMHLKPIDQSIDISALQPGMYLIQLNNGNRNSRHKLVVYR